MSNHNHLEELANQITEDFERYNEITRLFSSVNYSFSVEEDESSSIFAGIGNFGITTSELKKAKEENGSVHLNLSWVIGRLPKEVQDFVKKFESEQSEHLHLTLQYQNEKGGRNPYLIFDNIEQESEEKTLMRFLLTPELIEQLEKEKYVLLEFANVFLLQVDENRFGKMSLPISAIPIYLIDFEEDTEHFDCR